MSATHILDWLWNLLGLLQQAGGALSVLLFLVRVYRRRRHRKTERQTQAHG